jgi:hypothetical protein
MSRWRRCAVCCELGGSGQKAGRERDLGAISTGRDSVEKLERPVCEVDCVVSAVAEKSDDGLVNVGQPILCGTFSGPRDKRLRLKIRVDSPTLRDELKIVTQAVGGYSSVHQHATNEL